MMGRLETDQRRLFYDFNIEDVVPQDHLVRKIDAVVDFGWLRDELAPYYSHTGRPSIDPELMLRMLIVGYVFAIRSERQLCSELQVNMAYRWFCGLSIEEPIPNHSAFSRARHERFREADILRRVFEQVVGVCIEEGLVGGTTFSVDASLVTADVDRTKRLPGNAPIAWPEPENASRAVREYLTALDRESPQASVRADGRKRHPRMAISLTDPQAAWTAFRRIRSIFAYHANYLLDHKAGIIIDADGNRANRIEENRAALDMLERVAERFGLTPKRLAADTAYGNTHTLKRLVERGIEPHIPVWDRSAYTDGLFSRDDFRYDEKRDVYICPAGKELTTSGTVHEGTTLKYLAKRKDCSTCALKPNCTTGKERRIGRDVDQPIRDYVRSLADTPAFKRSRDERKKVEMAFAHMKRIFKLDRLRLRGLSGARDEVLLTATAQNLRKLARYSGRATPSRRSFATTVA
jgi:transposase